MTLSDTRVLKYALEMRQILELVRQMPMFRQHLKYEAHQMPSLDLLGASQSPVAYMTPAMLLARDCHVRMGTLVADFHQLHKRALQQAAHPYSNVARYTCRGLSELLGVEAIAGTDPDRPDTWWLTLVVDNYRWLLGEFDDAVLTLQI